MDEAARRAEGDDVARLVELSGQARAELQAERGGRVWSVRDAPSEPDGDRLAAAVAAPDAFVVAGTYAGAVVGYGTARLEALRDGTTLGVLDEIYVEPEARGVGVGEAMMDLVLAWCVEHGCRGVDSVALPGMRETKNFFERFGLTARAIVVHRALTDRPVER